MFEENIKNFRTSRTSRGYPNNLVDKILSEVKFTERNNTLTQTQKPHKRILPFVTQFHPSEPRFTNILIETGHLIQNQPLVREIYKEPPSISYRKGKSLNPFTATRTSTSYIRLLICYNNELSTSYRKSKHLYGYFCTL